MLYLSKQKLLNNKKIIGNTINGDNMKKYLLIIFIFFISVFLYKSNDEKIVSTFLYKENLIYDNYRIEINSYLDKYINVFERFKYNDYIIKKISLSSKYNNYINEEVDNININGSNYKEFMNEYIESYLKILEKYELENEISKIKSGNFKINYIEIYTSKDVYLKIKELFTK